MRIRRTDLLNRLLAIEPGITQTNRTQTTCVVFKKKWLFTMNNEIACAIFSGLPDEFEGAVEAGRIINLLKLLPDDFISVRIRNNAFILRGDGRRLSATMQDSIQLPIDQIERPSLWKLLKSNFNEAVSLVCDCTKKNAKTFSLQCVHIHPKWMEASDDTYMLRYPLKTFVEYPVLVRGHSLKAIEQLGMTHGAETPAWLHFKNPMGLRYSIRKFIVENYPPLEEFLNLRGRKIIFPKGMYDCVVRASGFCNNNGLKVSITKGKLGLEANDGFNEYTEERKFKYQGESFAFSVPPKVLIGVLDKSTKCEVTDVSIRVDGGGYVYAASTRSEEMTL